MTRLIFAAAAVLTLLTPRFAQAADKLLFCNQPERMINGGTHADALIKAGQTYRIFLHYRNGTRVTAPLVVSFQGTSKNKPLSIFIQKGIAKPQTDPSEAGKQATARFMASPARQYVGRAATGRGGAVRFPVPRPCVSENPPLLRP
jgi:hypothetical protein